MAERGIEVNLEKIRALQEMRAPQNTREVQRLVGRIIALSRFISRMTDRSLHFSKVLWKSAKFAWDQKCEHTLKGIWKTWLYCISQWQERVYGYIWRPRKGRLARAFYTRKELCSS